MKRFIFLVLFCLCLNGCSPTRIYFWAKENTGAERFVRDHNGCLQKADFWPWAFFNPNPVEPDLLNLRLNLKNGGIWANFSPYPGAMPIFVNTATPSKTVIYWWYSRCMKKLGYRERLPYGKPL